MTPLPATPPPGGIRRALPTWLHASDIQGLAQLATQGVLGATKLSESAHGNVYKSVAAAFGPMGRRFIDSTPGSSGVKPLGITGVVYGSVRGITRLAGGAVDAVLHRAMPLFKHEALSPQREAMLAAINGVLGDHLLETANPLAIAMSFRHAGRTLVLDKLPLSDVFREPTGKLLVTVHGLCMNDLQWQGASGAGGAGGAGHAEVLAQGLGYTPVNVHYNTGLHTSVNGAQLALLLERLVAAWPQPVNELTLLAHSMGGLVVRSACQQGELLGLAWRLKLKNIVCLGTPHHGAPLEQIGNWVDRLLGSNLFTRPFAAIGQIRSSGITDLRYGNVRASDWEAAARFDGAPGTREPLALPKGVNCFAVAGTVASPAGDARRSPLTRIGQAIGNSAIVGDGLVPLASALGQHADGRQEPDFLPAHRWVAEGINHMALLNAPEVSRQLLAWLGSPNQPTAALTARSG